MVLLTWTKFTRVAKRWSKRSGARACRCIAGKILSLPHSKPDTESLAISFGNSVGNARYAASPSPTFAFHVSSPAATASAGSTARSGEFTRGIPKSSQQTEAVNPGKPITQAASYNESLDLMHRVMVYRHEPIHSELMKIRDKYSMLHVDVLILVYHFAKLCSGAILEIGAFVGGATIAAALGVRDSGQEKKLIAVEPGGSVKHKRLGTRNILRNWNAISPRSVSRTWSH